MSRHEGRTEVAASCVSTSEFAACCTLGTQREREVQTYSHEFTLRRPGRSRGLEVAEVFGVDDVRNAQRSATKTGDGELCNAVQKKEIRDGEDGAVV